MPDNFYEQIQIVKNLLKAFNIPILDKKGYEADDIIGTITEKLKNNKDVQSFIVTGDLDTLQLISDKVFVYTLRRGIQDQITYDKEKVFERFELKPEQLIDWKALRGDPSDNIPGVPKVGDKTAAQLLKEFGSLDEILENVDRISKKSLKENIKRNVELAKLSRRLATIVTNVPIEIDFDKCKRTTINWQKVLPLFEKFEFDRLVKKYSKGLEEYQTEAIVEKKREEISKLDFKCVRSDQELKTLIDELRGAPAFAFDLETTSVLP